MSKSALAVTVPHSYRSVHPPYVDVHTTRTIKVPCRLPDSFTFWFKQTGYGYAKALALLNDFEEPKATSIAECELAVGLDSEGGIHEMDAAAERILATAKSTLGLNGPVPPGSPLQSIALAYEAGVAAYDAAVKAHRELPRAISGDAMYWVDPREGNSMACRMLAKYVEYVFDQAVKAHEEKP